MRRADSDDVSFGAPIITIYLPVWDKDHSITLVPFNDRYQKSIEFIEKNTWLYGENSRPENGRGFLYNNTQNRNYRLFLRSNLGMINV